MHNLLNNKIIKNIVNSGEFTEFWNLVDKNKHSFNKVLYLFNKLRSDLNLQPVGLLRDELIKGGLADKLNILDIVKKHYKNTEINKDSIKDILNQLILGVDVEMEHTDNPQMAYEIAMDHLYELPDYYSKLSTIEEKFASKAQAKYFYAKAREGGKEGKKWKKMADEFASKTDFSKIPEKVNERIISYTKDSSVVEVKDECKLGGGKICNQGDINALKITKIKE
jgi:hypothetical protein